MFKRSICLFVSAVMILAVISACSNDEKKEKQGNIHEITGPEPGDTYAEFEFKGFEEKASFKLFPENAPIAVEQFVERAERGYYDNRNIHRVIEDLFIQGGSV
ncbi:MAG: peptidylprolyl isomerase, partial [Oscillospiraceae bacterium]|nr:peptidylprolyl isomerase [Oscillospiraceae bacterium]